MTLAWYFSGEQKYADKAISLIRTWFIDPDTRMNPNLDFAQGVPGIAAGRGTGVLDGRYFATRIVDSLIMLQQNTNWTVQDEKQIRHWMTEYLQWLRYSAAGKKKLRRRIITAIGMRYKSRVSPGICNNRVLWLR